MNYSPSGSPEVKPPMTLSLTSPPLMSVSLPSPGLVIYFSYGMWNSNLELHAREEEASASSYQRYDGGVDDSFGTEDAAGGTPYPQEDDEPYQGWGAQQEAGYQQQYQAGPPQWHEGDGRT